MFELEYLVNIREIINTTIEYSLLPISIILIYYYYYYILFFIVILYSKGIILRKEIKAPHDEWPAQNYLEFIESNNKWLNSSNYSNINQIYEHIYNTPNLKKIIHDAEKENKEWEKKQFQNLDNGLELQVDYYYLNIKNKNPDKYIEIELIIAFIDIIINGVNNNINNQDILKMMHNAKCCLLANYEGRISYIKNENIYVNYDKLRNKNTYLSYLNSVKQNLE